MFIADTPYVVDLEDISTKQLVKMLIEARGQRKCAWLRTKLNQKLEASTGYRGRSNGKDWVLTNGRAAAVVHNN